MGKTHIHSKSSVSTPPSRFRAFKEISVSQDGRERGRLGGRENDPRKTKGESHAFEDENNDTNEWDK